MAFGTESQARPSFGGFVRSWRLPRVAFLTGGTKGTVNVRSGQDPYCTKDPQAGAILRQLRLVG